MVRKLAAAVVRMLASVQLAVVLIVVLAAVLAVTTMLESSHGREYVRYYVYTTRWFMALLGVLGLNVLMAALVRFPWKARQIPFLTTHAGILVLLAGSVITFERGVEGRLVLDNGAASDKIILTDMSSVVVRWTGAKAPKDGAAADFSFDAGPEDWPNDREIKLGDINGAEITLRRFLAHASVQGNEIGPVDPEAEDVEGAPAAIRADITVGGVKQKVWLLRGTIERAWRTVQTPEGELQIGYGFKTAPLDFAVRLVKFIRTTNPGGMGDAGFGSTVEVMDNTSPEPVRHEIAMNEPLLKNNYAFYQSGILPGDRGSIFQVAYDPGLSIKYLGSLMICLGTVTMFVVRSPWYNRLVSRWRRNV